MANYEPSEENKDNLFELETEFSSCLSLVSKPETVKSEERKAIIQTMDRFLSHISARRYCDMSEEFFLEGQFKNNMFSFVTMKPEDYALFDKLITSYRKTCSALFGEGVVPHNYHYDFMGVTEETMTADPSNSLAHQTHIFMRAITLMRDEEIFNKMAEDPKLVQEANARAKKLIEISRGDQSEEFHNPDTDAKRIAFLMKHYENSQVFELSGMILGDAPRLSLAIKVENAILSKSLAEEDAENIPIGALLSRDEIKKMVQSVRESRQKKTSMLSR